MSKNPAATEAEPEQIKPSHTIKLLLVGNCRVGKTSMLNSYLYDTFQSDYFPTISKQIKFTVDVTHPEHKDNFPRVEILTHDVSGSPASLETRKSAYEASDLVFMCYSRDSLDSIRSVNDFIEEMGDYGPLKREMSMKDTTKIEEAQEEGEDEQDEFSDDENDVVARKKKPNEERKGFDKNSDD